MPSKIGSKKRRALVKNDSSNGKSSRFNHEDSPRIGRANPFSKYKNLDEKQLKLEANKINPILRLGKSGISDSIIDEIKLHLKKRHLIKIKLLPAFLDLYDKREICSQIAEKSGSRLIQQVGGTLVLFKK